MKVLVTGASGLLGSNISLQYADKHKIYAAYNTHHIKIRNCNMVKLDITDRNNVKVILDKIKPDLVIHCAAFTSVDMAENNYDLAYSINVNGTKNLVDFSKGSKFIYISTDMVFDGTKSMFNEEDKPNPLNKYAKTKLLGEKETIKHPNCIIARTNIYGWSIEKKQSFSEWIINSLNRGEEITLFKDVYFTPIPVNNLADALFELAEQDAEGTYHIAGSQRCSKLNFGERLAEVFRLDKSQIKPISIDDKNLIAKRPKDMSLDVSKAQKVLKTRLFNLEEGLLELKRLQDSSFVKELKSGAE